PSLLMALRPPRPALFPYTTLFRSAYMELGWGGYWAWDPVENASFLPWLTGTAFLHSIIIQEQRGILKVWNIILIWLTYFLVILGDRKSTRLNSSHVKTSYAVFCLT